MDKILHQLIWMIIIPIIYRVLTIPGGAGFLPSTVFLGFMFHFGAHDSKSDLCESPPQKLGDTYFSN